MGQAFRIGRYPIHFHMMGDSPSSYVRSCSIHETFNRAANIHASNYLKIDNNFIYDIRGGAFFLEDGVEIGNTFSNNLAIFVRASSSLLNEDATPAAFWITNANNTVIHNRVAGSTHFGFWYRFLDRSDGPSFNPNYCPKNMPMGEFFNNSAHSCGRFGLWVFPGYTPTVSGSCGDTRATVARFESFTGYRNDKTAEWVMANNVQFRNFVSFDDFSVGIETKTIAYNDKANTQYANSFYDEEMGPLIADSVIIGNSDQSKIDNTPSGLVVAWDRGQLIRNVSFLNFPSKSSQAIRATEIRGRCLHGCGGWTTHFSGLSFSNVAFRSIHRWDWDLILADLDGSLSGVSNSFILAQDQMTENNPNCKKDSQNKFKNGIVCSKTNNQIRFSYNELSPKTVLTHVKNVRNSQVTVPYLKLRLTHPFGFTIVLEANQAYLFEYDQAAQPTNVSYIGTFYGLKSNEFIIVKHKLLLRPDRVRFGGGLANTESATALNGDSESGSWHWDNSSLTLSYIIANSQAKSPFLDVSINFQAYKCRYLNCVFPTKPVSRPPITSRPNNALFWSNTSTWIEFTGQSQLPSAYSSVKIPENYYVVVDIQLPPFKHLQIDGVLEFDDSLDNKLEAEIVFINGGQLIIGWPNKPMEREVSIVLKGTRKDDEENGFQLPNGYDSIGRKAIGVYGGLDLHGKVRTPVWTKLATTAEAGTKTIVLKDQVDWQKGNIKN